MTRKTLSQPVNADFPLRSKLSLVVLGAFSVSMAVVATNAQAQAIRDPSLFTANTLAANDDGSTDLVPIGFTLDFFGSNYDSLYVNNNGNVTFDNSLSTFTPFELLTTNRVILAPFFADVDTRGVGSGLVQYGQNTLDGRNVFGVNWIDVGYFSSSTDKLNSFQLVVVDRADIRTGDFDFEFNYDQIQWETGGASGGTGGLGGNSARVGWSDGVAHAFELTGSAVNGAFLDGGPNALVAGSLNSSTPGRYLFSVRDGQIGALLDFDLSLSSTGRAVNSALRQSELVMNGAHGRPLARWTEPGQNVFWAAGDWGRDDHGNRSGSLGVAEIGGGRNLGAVQLNGAVGYVWNHQNLPLSGSFKHRGTYLLAEALVPLKSDGDRGLWLTVGGYYSWGDTKIRRGYIINGGQRDSSSGRPDVELWNLRARLDWNNAFYVGDVSLSPYAELAYNSVKLDGYTEKNGSYPARFSSRKEESTDVRLGLDAARPIGNELRLLGRIEANHRLDARGPSTKGELLTVSTFDYSGVSYDRTWLRVGAGVEGKVGGGVGSLMLNATSKGEAPSAWIAVNWVKAF